MEFLYYFLKHKKFKEANQHFKKLKGKHSDQTFKILLSDTLNNWISFPGSSKEDALNLNKNISEIGNKGLFTKEIDEAQLRAEIDIGVHSLKDLPTNLPEGLIIAAVLPRGDCRDVIYSKNYKNLNNLKKKAIIGTSSIRRAIQLKHLRPDLVVKEIRGNVETRIKKIKDGKYDAIILAAAGLKRLGIKKNFFERCGFVG